MKRFLIALSFFTSLAAAADEVMDNSITVHNDSSNDREIWVNAVAYTVSPDSSLRVGCHAKESIEVQIGIEALYFDCGSQVELN